ncbi:hypothetical protein Y032_0231g2990 [Ancylostoma ceylanicum]|uniref:F-box domain-containing protein n=1 Tax=Ancylostoma ceylanicum TaxID=53326 RepID=A0A016SFG4_9BILA|nr:hypothetical protein Y032_0231g2990 [Ancylostoma ceylanicum]
MFTHCIPVNADFNTVDNCVSDHFTVTTFLWRSLHTSSDVLGSVTFTSVLYQALITEAQVLVMDFSLLPEEVLVNVLKMSSPTTVVVAKRLNRKLNRIVERNHLGKPHVDDFSVEMRTFLGRTRPIGKLQLKNTEKMHRRVVVTMKRKHKSRQVVEEGLEGPSCSNGTSLVMEEMKKVQLYERLSFDGVTADTEFFNMLTAKWNDLSAVQSLSFTLCHLKFSKEQMLSLLTRTACRSLTLDFCHFEQDIISDKVGHKRLNVDEPRAHAAAMSCMRPGLMLWSARICVEKMEW